jgi:enolase
MPLPMTNMISGGLHAGGNLDFQDFLIMPVGAPSYRVGLEWIVRVYRRLGELLTASGYEGRLVGDEGGFGPRLPGNRSAAEFVLRAIETAGLRPVDDVTIALDVASSHFCEGTRYRLQATGDEHLTSNQMIDEIEHLVETFPITSIEDGLAEDDWDGWRELTRRLGDKVQLVGDDLFATNPERIHRGITSGAANAVLIKLNQIGSLSETLEAMALARSAGYGTVVSARSGETEDATIADLAVATAADQIKIGSIQRSERLAKYNRLLAIEEDILSASPSEPTPGYLGPR